MLEALGYLALGAVLALAGEQVFRAVQRALALRESLLHEAITKADDAIVRARRAEADALAAKATENDLRSQLDTINLSLGLKRRG